MARLLYDDIWRGAAWSLIPSLGTIHSPHNYPLQPPARGGAVYPLFFWCWLFAATNYLYLPSTC